MLYALFGALSGHGIYSLDEDGIVRDWSESAARLKLYDAADVIGRDFSLFYPPEARAAREPEFALRIAAERGRFEESGWRVRKDGSRLWATSQLHALRDGEGTLTGFVKLTIDQSAFKARETELMEAKRLAEAEALAKSSFLASMSHELRTPLNAISGFAQLLKMWARPLSEKHLQYVDAVLDSSELLIRLINDILDYAKTEAGGISMVPELVDLGQVIGNSRHMLSAMADRRKIALDMRPLPSVIVVGDSARVTQVVTNLLSNAIKYNKQGGAVRISLEAGKDGLARVNVVDTGVGIPASRIGELFTPFNRLGRERSTIEGSGIGLAMCRKLLNLMQGEIGATCVEDSETCFWFTLPLADHAIARDHCVSRLPQISAASPSRKILYVEDNWMTARLFRDAFQADDNVLIEIAETGADGLAQIADLRPALIVIDLHLPDMSGFDLLKTIRSGAAMANVPAFAVTADADPRTRQKARDAGFDLLLTKPCQVSEIRSSVLMAIG